MAKVKIQGHASGTGILTITAPNTSTDRTVTLPDATGTLLNSDGDGSSLTGIQSPLVEGTDYLAPDGDGSSLTALDATTLTGNLPAIDGSNLTGVAPTKSVVEALGIDVPATNLTGTVPTASLGSGTADSSVHLRGDGAWASAAGGLNSVQIFTSSGTWTKPAGITKVIVEVQGGGSSGADGNAGTRYGCGGAGGYVKKLIDVSSISSATVTIGSGGAGVSTYPSNAGGASIWSDGTNTLTGGGAGAAGTAPYYGGPGGTATGGDLNITGQRGGDHESGQGADSMFGFGGTHGSASSNSQDTYDPTGYGSGSCGLYVGGTTKNAKAGIVIVTEYK